MNKVIDSIPGPLEEESQAHTGRVSKDGDPRLKSLVRNEMANQKRSHSHLKNMRGESLTKIQSAQVSTRQFESNQPAQSAMLQRSVHESDSKKKTLQKSKKMLAKHFEGEKKLKRNKNIDGVRTPSVTAQEQAKTKDGKGMLRKSQKHSESGALLTT